MAPLSFGKIKEARNASPSLLKSNPLYTACILESVLCFKLLFNFIH